MTLRQMDAAVLGLTIPTKRALFDKNPDAFLNRFNLTEDEKLVFFMARSKTTAEIAKRVNQYKSSKEVK